MPDKWPRDLWLEAIWEDPTLKPNERVVAYCYARYAFEGWTAWCSWAEVMRRTGIKSKNGVWLALRGLVAAGWLVQVERSRQHRSAVYRLTAPASAVPEKDLSGVPEKDLSIPEVPKGTPEVPKGTPEVPRLRYQNLEENSEEKSNLSSDRGSARSPSGAQTARCPRCNGRGWFASRPGCLEPCTECRAVA